MKPNLDLVAAEADEPEPVRTWEEFPRVGAGGGMEGSDAGGGGGGGVAESAGFLI